MQRRFGLERSLQSDLPPLPDPSGGVWIRLRISEGRSPLWPYQPERLSSSSVWFLPNLRINRLLERINSDAAGRRALLRGLAHDLAGPQTRMALRFEVLLADRDRPTLRFEEVALDDLCARLGASYPAGDLRIAVPRVLVRLDVVGLERSLRNLIDNALDHGRPPVELSAWREGGDLLLQVDDHGRGLSTSTLLTMPPQTHSHDRQRMRHRGLGLAIVESSCRDHGGQLSLGTAPTGGLRARPILRSTAANPLFVNP